MITKTKQKVSDSDMSVQNITARNMSIFQRPDGLITEFAIGEEIGPPTEYATWFDIIRQASEDDTIYLRINSCGGNLDTTLQFLRVLQETKAHTIASLEGVCKSAATILFLACKSHEVSQFVQFMCHDYSNLMSGKGGELHSQVANDRKMTADLFREIYDGFMTSEEIEAMIGGTDFYFNAEEVVMRLTNRAEKNGVIVEGNSESQILTSCDPCVSVSDLTASLYDMHRKSMHEIQDITNRNMLAQNYDQLLVDLRNHQLQQEIIISRIISNFVGGC